MPDFLQDLYDRMTGNYNQYTPDAYDPTLTDEEAKKKQKRSVAPDFTLPPQQPQTPWSFPAYPWAQAGALPSAVPLAGGGQPLPYPPARTVPSVEEGAIPQQPQPVVPSVEEAAATSQPRKLSLIERLVNRGQPIPKSFSDMRVGSAFDTSSTPTTAAAAAVPPQPPQPQPTPPPPVVPPPKPSAGPPPEMTEPELSPEGIPLPPRRPASAPPREPSGDSSANHPDDPQQRGNQPGRALREGVPPGTVMSTAGPQAGMLDGLSGFGSKILSGLGEHSNMLMALGAGMLGAPNIAQGMSRGLSYAVPAAQADYRMAQQMGGQTGIRDALINAGAPRGVADAAMIDSDVRKQAVQQYLMSQKKSVDVKLPNGQTITLQHDERTGQYFDMAGRPYDPGAIGQAGAMIDPNLTGEEARKEAEAKVDPSIYRQAMRYVNGEQPLPVGRVLSSPQIKPAYDLAVQIDPKLESAAGKLRNETILDYGPKGKTGQARMAMSTMLGHADQLDQLNKIIDNYNMGGEHANAVRNWFKKMYGQDLTYLNAQAQARLIRIGLAGEANKALSGGHSVTGMKEYLDTLGDENTPAVQQHGAIQGLIKLGHTRLDEMQNQFDTSMNTRTEGYHMLSPQAQRIFRTWEGDSAGDWDAKAPGQLPGIPDDQAAFAPVAGAKPAAPAAPATAGRAGPGQVQWSVVQPATQP